MKDARIKGDNTSKVIRAAVPETYEQFRQALANGTQLADILTNSAGYEEPGTALNKKNLLTDETAEGLGLDPNADPTVNDALSALLRAVSKTKKLVITYEDDATETIEVYVK
jgi:hypothetical protein